MSSIKRGFKRAHTQDDEINFNSEDVDDSEDEYSERESRLLEKARNKPTVEKFDAGEDKVYALLDGDDSAESEMEESPERDELPNERAWGRKKGGYFSTDYVDQDYGSASRKDLADAETEEREARRIEKRLAEQLDDADFGLDLFKTDNPESSSKREIVKTDLRKLGKREKQALMRKENPEFEALVTDFRGNLSDNVYQRIPETANFAILKRSCLFITLPDRVTEAKNVLSPFLKLVGRGGDDWPAVRFLRAKYQLTLNYCVNISFYLLLKAKRLPVNSHPVVKRLAQYRRLLGQLENGQGELSMKAGEIVEAKQLGKALFPDDKVTSESTIVASRKNKCLINEAKEAEEEEEEEEEQQEQEQGRISVLAEERPRNESVSEPDLTDEFLQGEKRGIGYKIARNKGLTPHRKKEQRNPRVKHRNKYRKAKIRRKGAVREVRREIGRYDGEMSGIKASVTKSTRIR